MKLYPEMYADPIPVSPRERERKRERAEITASERARQKMSSLMRCRLWIKLRKNNIRKSSSEPVNRNPPSGGRLEWRLRRRICYRWQKGERGERREERRSSERIFKSDSNKREITEGGRRVRDVKARSIGRRRNIQLHSERGRSERGSKLAIYSELGERWRRLHVRATSVDSNYGAVSSIICCIDCGARSGTMEYVRWSTELLLAEEEARLMTRINEITRLNGKEDE